MSSEDEKAALQARLYESIKGKGPGWQEASLSLFLSKASEPEPRTTPPVIYLPSAVTSEANTAAAPGTKAGNVVRSAATLSGYINTSEKSLSLHEAGAIGRGVDTGDLLSISDTARRSGLYILGRSGSGKTELLKRMILSDIDRGHGVFFVDPHGDAIDDLITRLPAQRLKDVISLDPDLEDESFGINLLSCNNIASWSEREVTYNRAKAVFDKLWKNMPEELPWLQLIIEHTLPVFIYNPEFTLAEVPLFYKDADFRRFLLRSVTQDPEIVDFWQTYFHQKQADAAMTRVWTLLGRPPVKDIVSQQKSTIDFAAILAERKILFVKLSANLSVDTKKFIGTILISELLHAVRNRPNGERHQFCIFVDEFQHFTASDDFATLINEARKFGIATTVAHQERFGQFADDRKLLGATDAAGNKIFFQLGGKDAEEQALEFAVKPPTETRREEQYALSQNPVSDLLARGHVDPDIRVFINKYLRHLDDKRDDIKADMEGEKFARMIELDTAAIYGAEAQGEGIAGPTHYEAQAKSVSARQVAISLARMHAINLATLHKKGDLLRVTMRQLNRFLTEVMEGERQAEQEAFADFLVSLAAGYSGLPEDYAEVLGLYIKVTYGDNNTQRAIPFGLGSKVGHFWAETTRLTNEAARKQAEERSAFERQYKKKEWDDFYYWRKSARLRREVMKYVVAKAMARKLNGGDQWYIVRHWDEDYGRGFAEAIGERGGGYGPSIGCIYYKNYYAGKWYTIDHFAPQMDYLNRCAANLSPEDAGKEPLEVLRQLNNARSYLESSNMRKDVAERRQVLEKRWRRFSEVRPAAARDWATLDKVGRWYLLMRACDWVMYGKEFANWSFPAPSDSDLNWVVSSLVWLFEEHEAELVKELEQGEETGEGEKIERECARLVAEIVVSPPAHLTPRVLGAAERQAVRDACIKEIIQGPQVVKEVAGTIDAFAAFCELLSKPENHIKVRTGQYIERQVNARAEIDMVNEKARELVELPVFMAYARVRQERAGVQGLFKGKIGTLQLPFLDVASAQEAFARNRVRVEDNSRRYLKPREQIRVEIEKRQERWRGSFSDQQPATRGQEKRRLARSAGGASSVTEPDELPPGTQYKSGR